MVPWGAEDVHNACFGVTFTLLLDVRPLLPLAVCNVACLLLLPVVPPLAVLPLNSLLVEGFIFLSASVTKTKKNITYCMGLHAKCLYNLRIVKLSITCQYTYLITPKTNSKFTIIRPSDMFHTMLFNGTHLSCNHLSTLIKYILILELFTILKLSENETTMH
jgi:hypothetical protein